MSVNSRLFAPTLNFLSDQNKDKIHQAALKILAQIGMKIFHPQALELLGGAGCSVENDHIVKIPHELVVQALESTPKNIVFSIGRPIIAWMSGGVARILAPARI